MADIHPRLVVAGIVPAGYIRRSTRPHALIRPAGARQRFFLPVEFRYIGKTAAQPMTNGAVHSTHCPLRAPQLFQQSPPNSHEIRPTARIESPPDTHQLDRDRILRMGTDVTTGATTATRFTLLARVFLIRFESCRVYLRVSA